MTNNKLQELQDKIGYQFNDIRILKQALTHTSYANEHKLKYNYQRLEFLGDGILQMVVSDYLLSEYPTHNEGQLTKDRVALVSENALSRKAKEIGLNQYIYLGKGESATGGRDKPSLQCDVIEALTGAIWKDSGSYEAVKGFIYEFIVKGVEIINTDYKSRLFELYGEKLTYKLIDESGADHEKVFTVEAWVNGQTKATGTGKTKKQAEQECAKQILNKMNK